jgi:hypothetical protein
MSDLHPSCGDGAGMNPAGPSRMQAARTIALLALAGVVTLPDAARASEDFVAPLEQTYVELDVGYDHYVIPPLFGDPTTRIDNAALDLAAQLKVNPHVALDLDVPWAVGAESDIPGVHAAVGNILIGLRGFGHVLPKLLLWGGLSGGIPTMYQYSAVPASVLEAASFSNGLSGDDRFTPGAGSVRAHVGLEAAFASAFRERFEVAALLLIGANGSSYSSWNPLPAFALFDEVEARLPRDFLVGIRLQYFGVNTADNGGDGLYGLAGGVYAGYERPRAGLFVRLALLISPFPFIVASETAQLRAGYRF